MAVSQNGWSANDRSVIGSYTIPGTTRRIALRKGDVSVVLLDLFAWIDANIRPIDTGELDDWGFAVRPIRGQTATLSNHASGTAGDIDALLHPLGKRGTWGAAKARIDERLKLYEGVIRWGENYTGRPDGMHFEVIGNAAAVARIAAKLRRLVGGAAPAQAPAGQRFPTIRRGAKGTAVSAVQKRLGITVDGDFGPATERAVTAFQKSRGLVADGIVGPATYRALGLS